MCFHSSFAGAASVQTKELSDIADAFQIRHKGRKEGLFSQMLVANDMQQCAGIVGDAEVILTKLRRHREKEMSSNNSLGLQTPIKGTVKHIACRPSCLLRCVRLRSELEQPGLGRRGNSPQS